MPDYSAGTASVRIKPNADSFLKDLEAKLRAKRDPGFTVRVVSDVSEAKRQTAEFRQREQRNQLELDLDVDTKTAKTEVAKFRQDQQGREIEITVDADTSAAENKIEQTRQREQRRPFGIDVDADVAEARAEIQALRDRESRRALRLQIEWDEADASRRLELMQQKFGRSSSASRFGTGLARGGGVMSLNLGAVALSGLQPAITGLAQLAGALQQVAQAGIAVPGAIAGVSASVGTLVLGLSGVKDAWDAVSKASESSGSDSAASARAAVSASNSLRNALVDEADARKDVARATRDAKQQLQDLRIEQRGGMIDESRAILEAQRAREALASGDYSDLRDAMLDVAEADQRVIEIRNRNMQTQEKLNDANAKGIDGSDQVVAANERLVRSQQAVADAQAAVADSGSAVSAAQDAANKAMEALSPNARKLVETLVEMKPMFQEVRDAASEPLLEGKAEEFRDFFEAIKPNLTAGVSGIAEGWNQNISALLGSLGSDTGKGLIDRILGNTGDAQKKLSEAMDPLVRGVGTLAAAGTDVLPRLAEATGDAADRFADFIEQADRDGRLQQWIDEGLDGMADLGESVLNIGKSFTGITKAADGGGFLQWLREATGRLQTFLNSTEGQNKLKEYFDQGREAWQQIKPVLEEIPGLFKGLQDGATLYIGGMLPIIKAVADLLGEHPNLVALAVAAYAGFKTVSPIIQGIQTGMLGLSGGLTGLGTGFQQTRDNARKAMQGVDDVFEKSGREGSPLKKFSGGLAALGGSGVGAGIMGALATVAIPGLMYAYDKFNQKQQETAEKTDYLNERQKALETTLDRVTGKITSQTLESQIAAARNYDPGGQGGGIPGISQGDALAAATKLGIAPDVYGQALIGDVPSQKQVRDILLKNNLIPELDANKTIMKDVAGIDGVTRDLLASALSGDPEAVRLYTEAIETARKGPGARGRDFTKLNLANIAKQLSETGQAAVLSGNALSSANQALPGSTGVQLENQAKYGRFRIKSGVDFVIPSGTIVNSTSGPGSDYQAILGPEFAERLTQAGIPFTTNLDGSLTAMIPPDSPFVEKFKQGSRGRTKGPRGQGFLAELHGQEWVHDASTVDRYGDDVMNAMWRGTLDPKAVRGLLPGFEVGGPTDPNDPNNPNYVGMAVAPTAPVAPNPFTGGGIPGIVGKVASGAQGPINNLMSIAGQFLPGFSGGQGGQTQGGVMPGLFGLAQAGGNPALMQAWQQQTTDWLVNWGTQTLSSALGIGVQGGLGFFGLENSVLSPNNPWTRGALSGVGHFANLAMAGQQGAGGGATMNYPMSLPGGFVVEGPDALLQAINSGGGGGLLAPNPNSTDLIGSMNAIAADYGLQLTSGLDDRPGYHGQGMAGDFSNGTGNTAEQLAFANFLADNYAPYIKELIYDDPNFARTIKDGQIVGRFGDFYTLDQAGRHDNHVHVAIDTAMMRTAGGTGTGARGNYAALMDQIFGNTGAGAGSGAAAGLSGNQATVYDAMIAAGLPASEWAALEQLLNKESGFNPTAQNPKSTAYGMFQFLDTTWGTVGASKTSNAVDQALYGMQYIKQRYGTPSKAWEFWQANNWYEKGGPTPLGMGPLPDGGYPAVVHPEEFVISKRGRSKVPDEFLHALNRGLIDPADLPGFRDGGPIPLALINPRPVPPTPAPKPNFKAPDIKPIERAPSAPAASPRPAPPPVATPAPAPAPPPVQQQAPPPNTPPVGVAQPAPGPVASVAPAGGTDHTLPWINTAIDSGASAIGQAISTAIGLAAAGGGGAVPGLGAVGAIGPYVAGLVQQGGKIVKGVANVVSSALVGSVPGSFTTTDSAYGQTLRPGQRAPQTAMPRGDGGVTSYGPFYGHDTQSVMQEIQLHESIKQQTQFANHPGRI